MLIVMGCCNTLLPVVNMYSIGWCCREGQSRLYRWLESLMTSTPCGLGVHSSADAHASAITVLCTPEIGMNHVWRLQGNPGDWEPN